jgi:hypothetical protein
MIYLGVPSEQQASSGVAALSGERLEEQNQRV